MFSITFSCFFEQETLSFCSALNPVNHVVGPHWKVCCPLKTHRPIPVPLSRDIRKVGGFCPVPLECGRERCEGGTLCLLPTSRVKGEGSSREVSTPALTR